MHYDITENGRFFDVVIRDYSGQVEPLIASFRSCQEGTCNCKTDEYENLDSLQIEQGTNQIVLHLVAKEGAQFNRSNIENCLRTTMDNIAQPS